MIGIGIIGMGTMGQAHLQSLANIPDAKCVAVCDTDTEKAQKAAQPLGVAVEASMEALAARQDVQAIIVATPTPFHSLHAKVAINAGKHVLIELPMVRQVREGEELLALAKEKNVIISVNHIMRFYNEYEMIKQRAESGSAGAPGTIRLSRQTPHPRRWYANFESSGGVTLDAMTHEIDFLLWTFGKVKRGFLRGMQGRHSTERLDYALAVLRMENGAIAHIESSWCHYGQFNLSVEVAGNEGLIHYNNQQTIPMQISLLDEESGGRRYYSESPVIYPAHYRLLQQFAAAAQGKAKNPVSGEEGLEAVKVALALIESDRIKKPVTLAN